MSNPPSLLQLQRVIPVMESRELERGQLTCVSLEIYDDGAWIVFWIDFREDPFLQGAFRPPMPILETAAIDDLGNEYTGWLGGAYGGDSILRVGHLLSSAIAPEARSLELRARIGEPGDGQWSRTGPAAWSYQAGRQETSGVESDDYMAISISLT